jgi:hypothetical protein
MFEEDMEKYMGIEVFETGVIVSQRFAIIDTDTHPVGLEKHVGVVLVFVGDREG